MIVPLETGLGLLSAMLTPAVLISACGTLIFSTSTRLARVVDRVRVLTRSVEALMDNAGERFVDERRRHLDAQFAFYTERATLVQRSLTAFYVALGIFVGTTLVIGLTTFLPWLGFAPSLLGVVGCLELFRGCVLLVRETRLALRSLAAEIEFTRQLGALYQSRPPA